MNIVFLGKMEEPRVLRLAQDLAGLHHSVMLLRPKDPVRGYVRLIGNVNVKYVSSFNPERPGGWLNLFLSCYRIWRIRPEAVHLHGWRAASAARFLTLLVPEVTLVWTVDAMPGNRLWMARPAGRGSLELRAARWAARSAARVCDAIVSPTRQVQYLLLTQFGVRSEYIPDGYEIPVLADVPANHWGLKKGQYCVATARNAADIRAIAKAYAKLKTKKKLLIFAGSRIKSGMTRKYPFVHIIEPLAGRSYHSLLRQAAVVIAADPGDSSEDLLQAMDAKRAVVAAPYPLHQEVLGTCTQFLQLKDVNGLTEAIAAVIADTKAQNIWGSKARKRARAHFQWENSLREYVSLYHYPLVRRVPVDSLVPRAMPIYE